MAETPKPSRRFIDLRAVEQHEPAIPAPAGPHIMGSWLNAVAAEGRTTDPQATAESDASIPRLFSSNDPVWRVHSDASFLAGTMAAMLVELMFPPSLATMTDVISGKITPRRRLAQVADNFTTLTFASEPQARNVVRHGVWERHDANDEHAQRSFLWRHSVYTRFQLGAYQHFGPEPLTDAQMHEFVSQTAVFATFWDIANPPQTLGQLDDTIASFRPDLRATDEARTIANSLIHDYSLRGPKRWGYKMLVAGALAVAPGWIRDSLGIVRPKGSTRLVGVPLGRFTTATMRQAAVKQSLKE